jgi:hypothetical protein
MVMAILVSFWTCSINIGKKGTRVNTAPRSGARGPLKRYSRPAEAGGHGVPMEKGDIPRSGARGPLKRAGQAVLLPPPAPLLKQGGDSTPRSGTRGPLKRAGQAVPLPCRATE